MTSMASSTTEDVARYRELSTHYYSPTFSRRALGCSYDLPDKSPKKDKKWSIGSLFRRKKKASESSSDEDKKGFLGRRKKKSEKRRKSLKPVGTFDHVVITHPGQRHSFYANGHEDAGVLSDPTSSFPSYANRALPQLPVTHVELHQPPALSPLRSGRDSSDDVSRSRPSVLSDGSIRKTRRELTKARAEARRTSFNHDSSSDDDSQRSASSSKFRSDESLSQKHKDVVIGRKSRSARTERYFKRHSRDGENPKDYLRLSKSDAESSVLNWKLSDDSNRSPSRSPLVPHNRSPLPPTSNHIITPPQQSDIHRIVGYANSLSSQSNLSGVSTIPPSHGNLYKFRVSNSTSNPSYKPPLSMNDYNNGTRKTSDGTNSPRLLACHDLSNQRSISCDADIHRAPSHEAVIHAQLPIVRPNQRYRNLSLVDASQFHGYMRQPPPPPPRDPKRLITSQWGDNGRPNTCFFDKPHSKSFNNNYIPSHIAEPRKSASFNLNPNFRSTSEDHLPKECCVQLVQRPSSTTPDSSGHKKYGCKVDPVSRPENYQYMTDKKPRSRKPIFIQNSQKPTDETNSPKKILDFWKQKDEEEKRQSDLRLSSAKKRDSPSPQMFTCQTHVETQLFLPSVLQSTPVNNGVAPNHVNNVNHIRATSPFKNVNDSLKRVPNTTFKSIKDSAPSSRTMMDSTPKSFRSLTDSTPSSFKSITDNIRRVPSPFKTITNSQDRISKTFKNGLDSLNNNSQSKSNIENVDSNSESEDQLLPHERKSSNLEEALNELEAIYNSLKLGDEDLLERAEQREKESVAKRLLESENAYLGYGSSRGALSDSSFSYEPFDSVDSPRRKRLSRRSTVDRKLDDMAYRKINKERAATIGDPQAVLAKVSYLLASPVYASSPERELEKKPSDEPDITFDDVVYRNVKHANNTLKVTEPQPPFGIPLGPITPAANSDYLHAVPEDNDLTPSFIRKKMPDLVKDDLAFRNLRKDSNKEEPALPPLSPDDFTNNNGPPEPSRLDLSSLKKRRAVRSLSANIGSMFADGRPRRHRSEDVNENDDDDECFKNLTDIADAMEIARQVLKEKDNRIGATRRAFLSDSDSASCKKNERPLSQEEESRLSFLSDLKLRAQNKRNSPRLGEDLSKARPSGRSTPDRKVTRSPRKESTPIPVARSEENTLFPQDTNSQKSSFEDLLTAMAVEAKETTERITRELKQMADEKEKRVREKAAEEKRQLDDEVKLAPCKSSDVNSEPSGKSAPDKAGSLERSSLQDKLSEIDAVSEHAKLCEKLLECVVDSTELMASSRSPTERPESTETDPVLVESVANIVLSRNEEASKASDVQKKDCAAESDHDYENVNSDREVNVDEAPAGEAREPQQCRSPFEEHKAELIAAFRDLGDRDRERRRSWQETEHRRQLHGSVYDNVPAGEAATGKL